MLTFFSRIHPIPQETLMTSQAPDLNCFGDLTQDKGIKREDTNDGRSQAGPNSTESQLVELKISDREEPISILKRIPRSQLNQPIKVEEEQVSDED